MPIELVWDEVGRGFVFDCVGVVSGQEMMAVNERIYESPHLDRMRYQIVDFTRTERLDLTGPQARAIGRSDAEASSRNPDVRVAIVTRQNVIRGMSRMYELSSPELRWEVKILESVEDARAWLGLDAAPLQGRGE